MSMRTFVWSFGLLLSAACGGPVSAVESIEGQKYVLEAVPGSEGLSLAMRYDSTGDAVLERGFVKKGIKTGTWEYFEPARDFPLKTVSMVDGVYQGVYIEYNERGYTEMMAHYRNNKLHGQWVKYKFGQPVISAMYKDGQLDGPYQEFNQSGKLTKEINYREGKENGPLRYYNDEGEVTVEYEFRDGQKVGGGLKNPE